MQVLICDESHSLKSRNAARTKALVPFIRDKVIPFFYLSLRPLLSSTLIYFFLDMRVNMQGYMS
eukprot:COSAG05_NODE_1562_length_4554_cov_110.408305_1_plen_64_part_00